MTTRYTAKDVVTKLAHVAESAHKWGYDTRGWYIVGGSKSCGVSYKLLSDCEHNTPPVTHLGFTASEAWNTLNVMYEALYWAAHNLVPANN